MTDTVHPLAPDPRCVVILYPVRRLVAANDPEPSTLIALGALVARRVGDHEWVATLDHRLLTGDRTGSADTLVAACSDLLPERGLLVGWQLAEATLPVLIEAAAAAQPTTAQRFLNRMAMLTGQGSEDLAIQRGGAGAPRLDSALAALGEPLAPLGRQAILRALAGDEEPLVTAIQDRLHALWRLWLADRGRATLSTGSLGDG